MKRAIQVSSLTVGKCFTLDLPPGGAEERPRGEVQHKTSILAPAAAWKVESVDDDGVKAVSAAGETRSFPGATKVKEVQRQGWDKLVDQAKA
jgi:hypothetical protein